MKQGRPPGRPPEPPSRPLSELVVGHLFHSFDSPCYAAREPDPLEMLDAAWEDADGRLPHEPGYIDPLTRPRQPARARRRRRRTPQPVATVRRAA